MYYVLYYIIIVLLICGIMLISSIVNKDHVVWSHDHHLLHVSDIYIACTGPVYWSSSCLHFCLHRSHLSFQPLPLWQAAVGGAPPLQQTCCLLLRLHWVLEHH